MTEIEQARLFVLPASTVVVHAVWRGESGWTMSCASWGEDESPAIADHERARPSSVYEHLTTAELFDSLDGELRERRGF